jgi:very-short-patch-repair endonuclease
MKYKQILDDYINGMPTRKIQKKYSISFPRLSQYLKEKNVYRNKSDASKLACKLHPRKHTQEIKLKISKARKKYLNEHPDKIPYLMYHASKMSYPEKRFKQVLEESGIKGWIYNYPNGRYLYDFGFPELKLDVEIDGNTHTLDKVKKIDIERDEWAISKGWHILRFTASKCTKNLPACINSLLDTIKILNPSYDLYDINKNWKKIKSKIKLYKHGGYIQCKGCNKTFLLPDKRQLFCNKKCSSTHSAKHRKDGIFRRKVQRPSSPQLIQEIKSTNFCAVGRKYGVSDNAIRKWCKSYNIDMNIFKKKAA